MATKVYYHIVPNSRYITAKGEELFFTGGQLTTDDVAVQADLDAIINAGMSLLRSGASVAADAAVIETTKTITEAAAKAEEAKNAVASGLKPA